MLKHTLALSLSVLMLSLLCTAPQKKHIVITYDVEDYITPATEGIDDIPKWIAEIMSEEKVTGTFFVIGEKARSLKQRGREDVIRAMAAHEIGSHTNFGSIHPTVTEQLETAGWQDGVERMLQQESAGFSDLAGVFGKTITTLARHGGSYGPQLIAALGQMNAAYVGSPVRLPGRNVVWFCNGLNFYGQYSGFDNTYFRDDLFESFLDSLKDRFPKVMEENVYIAVFACHPCKIRTKQYWDFNYYYGENTDSSRWRYPELRPQESMETAKKNFRRLMRFLKTQENVEITSYRKLMRLYGKQKRFIGRKELHIIAQKSLRDNRILGNDLFSPAEVFYAMAVSLEAFRRSGTLPRRIERKSPLGPMETGPETPEVAEIPIGAICKLAGSARVTIETHGLLPSSLEVSGKRIGTGSLYALFSRVILDIVSEQVRDSYSPVPFEPYPKTHESVILEEIESYAGWPVHRRDLDMGRIITLTKNQLWTLKPAVIM